MDAADEPVILKDAFLARYSRDARAAAIQAALIVAWHLVVVPMTGAPVDWLRGYGASVNGVVQPQRFDIDRALEIYRRPIGWAALLTILLVEGLLSWIVFRLFALRMKTVFTAFICYWWRVCLWGTIGLPTVAIACALFSDIAIFYAFLWIACGIVGPTLFIRLDSISRYPPGHCSECGYDLTGNSSGVCPECGIPIRPPV